MNTKQQQKPEKEHTQKPNENQQQIAQLITVCMSVHLLYRECAHRNNVHDIKNVFV